MTRKAIRPAKNAWSQAKQMRHRENALEGLCGSASRICKDLAEVWYHQR